MTESHRCNRHTPAVGSKAMAERPWNAWRALRARPNVTFARKPLPAAFGGAVCARWPDGSAVIVVDPSLSRRERHEALAHELCHLEFGCCDTGVSPLLEIREESRVRREVARRCIPVGALQSYVERVVDLGEGVTPAMVADEFDTTEQLAELALRLLVSDPRRAA